MSLFANPTPSNNLFYTTYHHTTSSSSPIDYRKGQFRLEIRRSQLNNTFTQMRHMLVTSLQAEVFQDMLIRLKQSSTSPYTYTIPYDLSLLDQLITMLIDNSPSADFNLRFSYQQLYTVLAQLLLQSPSLTVVDRSAILSSLTYLTYYSYQSTTYLLKYEFSNYLLCEMKQLSIDNLPYLKLLNNVIKLAMNISSVFNSYFNTFLAYCDFPYVLNHKMTMTINILKHNNYPYYQYYVHKIRQNTLRFYKNIMHRTAGTAYLSAKILLNLLQDDIYIELYRSGLLLLLAEAVLINQLWQTLMDDQTASLTISKISHIFDLVQQRCTNSYYIQDKHGQLTYQYYSYFDSLLILMNNLYNINCKICNWDDLVINLLNGYMLADFLLQAVDMQQCYQILHALEMFKNLAYADYVHIEELFVTRPAVPKWHLLKIFTEEKLLKGIKTSSLCLSILSNSLSKDSTILVRIMYFRVLDVLEYILSGITISTNSMLSKTIDLLANMILSEDKIKQEDTRNGIVQLIINRGWDKFLEVLQDHSCRELGRKAENILEIVIKYSER